jgi:ribonuclease R
MFTRRKGKRPEGEVIEAVERHKTDFVGVIYRRILLLYLPNQKMYTIFYSKG